MSAEIRKVKTAVVGCGSISRIYIRNLKSLFTIIDLVAVCNRTRSKAEEKAAQFGVGKVLTLDEIADDPEIELVVNLTAPEDHYDVTKRMLESGKHVFTEKVIAPTLEEARALTALAKEKGLYLGAAPDTVLGAGIQTARKLLDAGMIGQVSSAAVSLTRNHNLISEVFPFLRREGGSILYDMGVYYVAALIALLGSVKAVRAFAAPAPVHEKQMLFLPGEDSWQIPGSNLVCAALEFQSGVLVSLHINGSAVGSEEFRFSLFGTEGTLHVGNPDQFGSPVTLVRPEGEPVQMPFTHGYDGTNTVGEPMPFDGSGNRGVGVAEMAWAIRRGRPNRLSGEYGLHCLEVLQGIEEAARTGTTCQIQSSCTVAPLKSGFYSTIMGKARCDAERSLMD